MIKSIYNSSAGMRSKMVNMEVVANNLANINSTGYKRDVVFTEILKETGLDQLTEQPDTSGMITRQYVDFTEGSLNSTNNPLDVAIQGRGFFVVETPNGMRYTRDGHFDLNSNGLLVTSDGYPVIGKEGRIQFPEREKLTQVKFLIDDSGEIIVDEKTVAKIHIVDFPDTSKLSKEGKKLFSSKVNPVTIEPTESLSVVRQGYLEASNVDGIAEMVAMIEMTRSFESNQKAIQTQDETLQKAIEVGKL